MRLNSTLTARFLENQDYNQDLSERELYTQTSLQANNTRWFTAAYPVHKSKIFLIPINSLATSGLDLDFKTSIHIFKGMEISVGLVSGRN